MSRRGDNIHKRSDGRCGLAACQQANHGIGAVLGMAARAKKTPSSDRLTQAITICSEAIFQRRWAESVLTV